ELAQNGHAVRVEPVSGNDIVGEASRLIGGGAGAGLERVSDEYLVAVAVKRIAEIAARFGGGGHARLARRLWNQLLLPLLRPEKEEFVFVLIETAERPEDALRQIDRPSDVIALIVVAVEIARADFRAVGAESFGVVEKAIRVEPFMAMEPVARAVKVFGAAFGHDLYRTAGRASVFGLVVRGQNLELGDVVEHQRHVQRTVRPGVEVGRAVHGQVMLIGARAVDVEPGGP